MCNLFLSNFYPKLEAKVLTMEPTAAFGKKNYQHQPAQMMQVWLPSYCVEFMSSVPQNGKTPGSQKSPRVHGAWHLAGLVPVNTVIMCFPCVPELILDFI